MFGGNARPGDGSVGPEASRPQNAPLGWHVIQGEHLLSVLRRCEQGESADLVFAELWANSEIDSDPSC